MMARILFAPETVSFHQHLFQEKRRSLFSLYRTEGVIISVLFLANDPSSSIFNHQKENFSRERELYDGMDDAVQNKRNIK